MNLFLVSLLFFVLFIAFMAVGVIFSNKRIQGSCGGLNNLKELGEGGKCDLCGLTYEQRKKQDCSSVEKQTREA